MTADSLDWPIMALGAVGADFEVVSPPELADRVRDWGRRFSRAGAPGPRAETGDVARRSGPASGRYGT
jgi:hypothetical protein